MSKAHVLGLMALQEKARMARTLADLRRVIRQKDETEQLVARLTEALARQGGGASVRLATEIMAERAMAAQLLAEVDRQRERVAALAVQVAEVQAKLGVQEQRHQKLVDEAGTALRQAAAERLALREAAMPPRRR
ncbi:MAG: hypothetical protein RL216_2058 [Pseudomonadota bacterium]|jgi:hypothetical protein